MTSFNFHCLTNEIRDLQIFFSPSPTPRQNASCKYDFSGRFPTFVSQNKTCSRKSPVANLYTLFLQKRFSFTPQDMLLTFKQYTFWPFLCFETTALFLCFHLPYLINLYRIFVAITPIFFFVIFICLLVLSKWS